MKRTQLPLVAAFLFLGSQAVFGAINIVHTGPIVPLSFCPAADGLNFLSPLPLVYVAPGADPALIPELVAGDTPFGAVGWGFAWGPPLNGDLLIDLYASTFVGVHQSGAEIDIRYNRAPGDPENLRWIQIIETSAPLNGAVPPYIDPFPNDDPPPPPGLPFYWTEAEHALHSNGVNPNGPFDLHFHDLSNRSHPPTSLQWWMATLYLVSWNGLDPGIVVIHDGITWGWVGACAESSGACCMPPSGECIDVYSGLCAYRGGYYFGDGTSCVNVTCPGCNYVLGDINGNHSANGIDVTYGVSYLKGGNAPPIVCDMCPQTQPFYAAMDVNGNCAANGIDITYFVSYLKGQQPSLLYCEDCPPTGMVSAPAPAVIPIKSPTPKNHGLLRPGE